jgi:hypothetical protein
VVVIAGESESWEICELRFDSLNPRLMANVILRHGVRPAGNVGNDWLALNSQQAA